MCVCDDCIVEKLTITMSLNAVESLSTLVLIKTDYALSMELYTFICKYSKLQYIYIYIYIYIYRERERERESSLDVPY